MFRDKLTLFVGKRVLICYILVSIIVIIFIDKRWPIFAGLTIGAFLSIMQLSSNVSMFAKLLSKETPNKAVRKGTLHYVLALLSMLAVLAAAAALDVWMFAGVAAGLLAVPFIICVNGLTEALGITHNNFE